MTDSMRRVALYLALAFCAPTLAALAGDDALVIRAQKSVGVPGGDAVMSLRTYASRPVGQGQICFSLRNAVRGTTFSLGEIKHFQVYALNDDVEQNMTVLRSAADTTVMLNFSSPSATINAQDGPLAAIFFTVDAGLAPGQEFAIELDLANTVLFDALGAGIPIETRDGRFTVRDPAMPLEVSADADQDVPGGPVRMSFQTSEPFDIGAGRVAIRYNNRLFPSPPQMHIDPRYGYVAAKFDARPGLAVFHIVAVNDTFNDLPGDILQFFVTPHPAMGAGMRGAVIVDPALTQLFAPDGSPIALDIESGDIVLN